MTETFTDDERLAAPEATHRISGTRAVCDGGEDARCHFWRACDYEGCLDGDGEHPDENHEHVYTKESCGWLEWINASDLEDSFEGEIPAAVISTLTWPEEPITPTWDGDSVLWHYTSTDPALAVDTKEGHHA